MKIPGLVVLLLFGLNTLHAQIPSPPEMQLQGRTVLLRGFLAGNKIEYSEAGEPLKPLFGIWTIHGYINIKKVKVDGDTVKIKADRLAAVYDQAQQRFAQVKYSSSVELLVPRKSDQQIRSALSKMFVTGSERFEDLLPLPWKRFFEEPPEQETQRDDANGGQCGAPKYGGQLICDGAIPPEVTSQPEPEFSDVATELNVSGLTTLECTVSETGVLQVEKIVHALGAGLDEQAIAAARQWKFKPAKKDGAPFKALISIEVQFRR